MSYRLHIKIEGLPPTVNALASRSWKARWGVAKAWYGKVLLAVGWNSPTAPLEKARVTLVRHSAKETDADNLASSFKYVLDGLVRSGVIKDDRPSVIGSPEFKWEKAKRGQGFVEIVVEEI